LSRILASDGRDLIGYTDTWSVSPGDSITLYLSSTEAEASVRVVRLRHGDPRSPGPGLIAEHVERTGIEGQYSTTRQKVACGSFGKLHAEQAGAASWLLAISLWTALPAAGRHQVLFERGDLRVSLDEGGLATLAIGGTSAKSRQPVRGRRWTDVATTLGNNDQVLSLIVDGQVLANLPIPWGAAEPAGDVTVAAGTDGSDTFNGKLEDLRIGDRAHDVRTLSLANGPTLAVTGKHWQSDETDFRHHPDSYAAVHFHEDDVEDAGWEPTLTLTVPDLPSGFYAFEATSGDLLDHIPFIVRPGDDAEPAPIGYLVPTLTYMAYSNERLIAAGDGGMVPTGQSVALDDADRWLEQHPEAGKSIYDKHPDGSGCSLVSLLRPIPNLRPDFLWWNTGAPERFGADLYIAHFLDQRDERWDAFTDHDLHRDGAALLKRYPVIVTGTHPEYVSGQMLDALAAYLASGGRLLYLGGNGFYWVTSVDPDRPHMTEIRRGINGTRAWNSAPGELRLQTTGEPGGLWRYRGRNPNSLVGVGFASQSDAPDTAPGYRRTEAAERAEFGWIFEGVSDSEIVGNYGMSLGGAAGYEIDRWDPVFDSPEESTVLMTSAALHPPSYLIVVEDLDVTIPNVDGTSNDRVRSDVVYMPYEGGGAVFSVGSCSWAGSLSHNGYDNDIARITGNVIDGFLTR
jgi:N,N-dimethylformamidase